MKGVHLCNIRLQLLRLNTMPAMDWHLLEDVGQLREMNEKQLRKLGRLAVPMVRHKDDKGFRRVSWDEAVKTVADKLRGIHPKRLGWYLARSDQRGLLCAPESGALHRHESRGHERAHLPRAFDCRPERHGRLRRDYLFLLRLGGRRSGCPRGHRIGDPRAGRASTRSRARRRVLPLE